MSLESALQEMILKQELGDFPIFFPSPLFFYFEFFPFLLIIQQWRKSTLSHAPPLKLTLSTPPLSLSQSQLRSSTQDFKSLFKSDLMRHIRVRQALRVRAWYREHEFSLVSDQVRSARLRSLIKNNNNMKPSFGPGSVWQAHIPIKK